MLSMCEQRRNEAIKKLLRDHTARVTVSQESAFTSLVADGVYTPDGKLAPRYGGEDENGKYREWESTLPPARLPPVPDKE